MTSYRNQFGIYQRTFEYIIEELQKIKEVEQAFIFGSRAMGNFKKGSDIDIAIKGKNVTFSIIKRLNTIFNDELPIPYFVDILPYNALGNEELQQHIDIFGSLIYDKIKK